MDGDLFSWLHLAAIQTETFPVSEPTFTDDWPALLSGIHCRTSIKG